MTALPQLRRQPGFRRFWVASTVSDLGTRISTVAIGVLVVVDLGGSAADVGLVQGATMLPYLAVGLFVGVLADRIRRKPLLVATDLGRAVALGCVPALWALGWLDVPVLVAVMLVFGLLSVLNAAAHQSFLPRLVAREQLHRANVRLDQSDAVAQTSGPLVGGGLVAAIGAPVTILVDALSYAVSGVLTALTPADDPVPERERRSVVAELREGVGWVYRHPTLRPLALGTHGWFLFHAVLNATYVPYALLELRLDAVGLGATFALAGVGALAGSSASERVGGLIGIPAVVTACWLLEAVGFAVIALAGAHDGPVVVVLAAGGQLLYGLGMGLENPITLSYRQALTPDRLQGRMNATIRSFNRAMVVVGAPLGGLLADSAGLRTALWVGVAGIAATGVLLLVSGFRLATHDVGAPGGG
ncbi:MFS transporter [Pseudonocardia humida]|uniref:MFS transporter n=1 Tax=Pseudonocardia humida TaxID=2800819 RepID=A0ABT1A2P4_9PSEU|nr:MFS transporter [Pseudonocardia humida]MCO1657252.1 MFS transporter [Pseudonocardia humida]